MILVPNEVTLQFTSTAATIVSSLEPGCVVSLDTRMR
jgi:hypothetical protein